jgi:hypothetical protein
VDCADHPNGSVRPLHLFFPRIGLLAFIAVLTFLDDVGWADLEYLILAISAG